MSKKIKLPKYRAYSEGKEADLYLVTDNQNHLGYRLHKGRAKGIDRSAKVVWIWIEAHGKLANVEFTDHDIYTVLAAQGFMEVTTYSLIIH